VAGAKTFEASCASCHGKKGEGGKKAPTLIGKKALGDYKDAKETFAYVKDNMPPDGPGKLVEQDFWNVTAFLAKQNGWAATEPLSAANAESVKRAK